MQLQIDTDWFSVKGAELTWIYMCYTNDMFFELTCLSLVPYFK